MMYIHILMYNLYIYHYIYNIISKYHHNNILQFMLLNLNILLKDLKYNQFDIHYIKKL